MASSWLDIRTAQCRAQRALSGGDFVGGAREGRRHPRCSADAAALRSNARSSDVPRRSSSRRRARRAINSARTCANCARSSLHQTCRLAADAKPARRYGRFRVHDFITANCGDDLLAHLGMSDAAMRVLRRRSESLPITLQGRVTSATPVPEAPDFMTGLTIKPT